MHDLVVNELIRLEQLKYSHAFMIFQGIDQNRAFLSPWLPFVQQTYSQEDTEEFVRAVVRDRKKGKDEVYVVFYDGDFAGLVGVKDTDRLNQKTEIGYWLIEKMTGKGIVSRSVKILADYLLNNEQINRIQIKCGVGNHASAAIPKRLGFQFEGVERDGERHNERFIDLEVYSLLRKDYRKY